ncbi:MAG: zinc-ribbon domain-containing protein [Lachnospiraceae bacterium]|nr:zinc-ribbon domain-containing protein [Lachnospiraceae bacterium]
MARFCGNCGAQLDDDARVCGQCGMPVDGSQGNFSGFKVVDPEKKKKFMNKMKMIFAIVIVIIIASAGVKIVRNFTGTNGLVRKVMAAYKKYDIDTIVSLSSDMYYYNDDENYVEEYFEYAVGNNIDNFESSVGHSYKMSYEVEEIYDLSQRKQDEILQKIEYSYPDFDVEIINKIAVANVKVTARQGSKSINKTVNITMSKEGKTWKLLYIE